MLKIVTTLPTRVSLGAEEFVLKLARSWHADPTELRPWRVVAFARFGQVDDVPVSPSFETVDEARLALQEGFDPMPTPEAQAIVSRLVAESLAQV